MCVRSDIAVIGPADEAGVEFSRFIRRLFPWRLIYGVSFGALIGFLRTFVMSRVVRPDGLRCMSRENKTPALSAGPHSNILTAMWVVMRHCLHMHDMLALEAADAPFCAFVQTLLLSARQMRRVLNFPALSGGCFPGV